MRQIKDTAKESQVFRSRSLQGLILITLMFSVIAGRFTYLQVFKHDEFQLRSESNRVKPRALAPNRGLIFDRNGILLADNQPTYRLELIPEQIDDVEATLEKLNGIIPISEDDQERFWQLKAARHSFQSIPVRLRLTQEEAATFAVNRHLFDGVDLTPSQTRVYPMGAKLAHVLGYVGRLDANDLNQVDSSDYAATTHIGKSGIERYYENHLHGSVGYEQVETNAQGRVLSTLSRTPSVAGNDLYLTLDAALQVAADEALGDRTGAIVAVDPKNGDILALVSKPTFDPNPFVNGVSSKVFSELVSSSRRPLFNRALQGGYEPGSTFKPYIALAGLESGVIQPDHTVFSKGWYQLPGQERKYRDWKREGHGRVNVVQAIAQSVNVFFYQLAVDLGIDRINGYLGQFGFGQPSGIDLHGEYLGILPSREWKRATRNLPWFPGETVITGIGQGFSVATPLQMAKATAILASQGQINELHLLRSTRDPVSGEMMTRLNHPSQIPIVNQRHWQLVIDGMEAVVHSPLGTARPYLTGASEYQIAGKSGTAQVYGLDEDEEYDAEEVTENLRDHALFVAFAPVENPQIAVAVVVEHGGGGSSVAAPVAGEVIKAYLDNIDQPTIAKGPAPSPVE